MRASRVSQSLSPDPPSSEEAARIIAAAWDEDEDWGTFVWLATVTGMRRAELLGIRWLHVELDEGMLEIRKNYVWVGGRGVDKHQDSSHAPNCAGPEHR